MKEAGYDMFPKMWNFYFGNVAFTTAKNIFKIKIVYINKNKISICATNAVGQVLGQNIKPKTFSVTSCRKMFTSDVFFPSVCYCFVSGVTQRVNGTRFMKTSSKRLTPDTTCRAQTQVRNRTLLLRC